MSQINTNVNSMISQRILRSQNSSLTKSMERLSTGLAINRGGDNPAGLIASERLRSEKAQISAAIGNAERADQVVNIAEGGLTEVQSLLTELQSLVSQAGSEAGLSTDEKEANQLQIDNILSTIDRISQTTSFQGVKLLNGNFDFTVESVDANVTNYQINAAKLTKDVDLDVNVIVTQSAQRGGYDIDLGGAVVNTGADDADSRLTFELAGNKGTREFTFASGTAIADVIDAVNQFTNVTGVSAAISGTDEIVLKSTEFGSDAFVSIQFKNLESTQVGTIVGFDATDENTAAAGAANFTDAQAYRDEGQDVGAIINGITARGRGLKASVSTDALDMSITLDTAAGGAQTVGSLTAMSITGGGANFNIGPNVDLSNQVRLGITNISARNIGTTDISGTTYNLSDVGSGRDANVVTGNVSNAQKIVNTAIDQVSSLRGRLGAFQKFVIGSTINALSVALENTSAAEASIRDTDFANETANLTRSQILVQAATSTLSIANNQPQNVLRLLG